MIHIVKCEQCSSSNSKPEEPMIWIEISIPEVCSHCRTVAAKKHGIFLCSAACVIEYFKSRSEDFLELIRKLKTEPNFGTKGRPKGIE